MGKPRNDLERKAAHMWRQGSPAAAMHELRLAGYSEADRAGFLERVLAVVAGDDDDLELHRDSYLDWYADAIGGETGGQ